LQAPLKALRSSTVRVIELVRWKTFAVAVVGDTAPAQTLTQFQAEYLERWIDDADPLFQNDVPALQSWAFAEEDLRRIEWPVLNIRGEHTLPFFRQAYLTLQKRLPHCESLIVPGVSHVVLQMAPQMAAQRITEFVHGHPSEEHHRAHSS
jgi:pimeloyl-ACP methyl ester carboxylesterase